MTMGRCPTCGQPVETSGPDPCMRPTPLARWRIQYWRNPAPKGGAVMELGVFTPDDEPLYAAPLTERNDQLAREVVAAMNATLPA